MVQQVPYYNGICSRFKIKGPPLKTKDQKMPRLPGVEITAGAATTEDGAGAGGPGGRVGRGGRRGRGGQGGRQGRSKWPGPGYPANENTGGHPHGKKRNEKLPSCTYCIARKRPVSGNSIGKCNNTHNTEEKFSTVKTKITQGSKARTI